MDVSVSLISYNTKELLKKSLSTLRKINKSEPIDIWVFDNASVDGSAQMVESEFPEVHLIKNPENLGFGRAQNLLLRKIKTEYTLILNPDTELPVDSISKMKIFMDQNPKCGISSGKLVSLNGRLQSNGGDLPVGLSLITWLFNLEFLGDLPSFHRQDKDYYETNREVGWVGGTFMFVRSEVVKRVGLFNEDYFMYFEDVELCSKVRELGSSILINPEVEVKHHSGASSKNPQFFQWKGEFVGLIKFYNHKFGSLAGLLIRLIVYISIVLRILAFTIIGRREVAINYAKVLFSI
jgi:GT2 family glycosyltransferase